MANPNELQDTVQQLYDQAVNEGSVDAQGDQLEELADEAGTTVEALKAAREAREAEAALRITKLTHEAVEEGIIASPNSEHDNWRVNEN